MANLIKELEILLALEALKEIINSSTIKIAQLNAAIALLIKANIPFDVEFESGTRREQAQVRLIIYVNPCTQLKFIFSID